MPADALPRTARAASFGTTLVAVASVSLGLVKVEEPSTHKPASANARNKLARVPRCGIPLVVLARALKDPVLARIFVSIPPLALASFQARLVV